MIEKAGLAEAVLSSAFSLHSMHRSQGRVSCPRAKVWLRRHRHSLVEVAMEEGVELAVDALNAVTKQGQGGVTVTVLAVALVALAVVLAVARRKHG